LSTAVSLPLTDTEGEHPEDAGILGPAEQLAQVFHGIADDGPARGNRTISIHPAGGLQIRVLPDRGLDIGAAWFAGSPVAWLSPVGETAWSEGDNWLAGWAGGLLTTCGLRNVGVPSGGHPMHGSATGLRASGVHVTRSVEHDGSIAVTVAGTMIDASAFGPVLRLERTITVHTGRSDIVIVDDTSNLGQRAEQSPILYHVNFGYPFLGPSSFVDGRIMWSEPRDPDSARVGQDWAMMGPPLLDDEDVVVEHGVAEGSDGWRTLRVVSPESGQQASVAWDAATLPRVHTWRRATRGSYAMAVEPANCSVLGREHDRAAGTAPWLEPGQRRRTRLRIEFSTL
jgi:hypothetical protein